MPILSASQEPGVGPSLAHLDHLLADTHELVVQLWVHHFRLLQLEDLLVALLGQLLLALLQTLDHLTGGDERSLRR